MKRRRRDFGGNVFVVTGGRRKGNKDWKEIGCVLFLAVSTLHQMKPHQLLKKNGGVLKSYQGVGWGCGSTQTYHQIFLLAMVSFSETDPLNLHIQKSHFQGLIIMRWNFKKHRDKDLWKRFAYLYCNRKSCLKSSSL